MPSSRIAILEGYSGIPRGYGRGESMPESVPVVRFPRRPRYTPEEGVGITIPREGPRSNLVPAITREVSSDVQWALTPRSTARRYRPAPLPMPSPTAERYTYSVPLPGLPEWATPRRRRSRAAAATPRRRTSSQSCPKKCKGKPWGKYRKCVKKCVKAKRRAR